jgi:Copper transport outer membrane protein, MctB
VISWRYHIVSIVAVVLAFGLGILAGTAVVNDEFVGALQQNFDQAQAERDEARAEVALLEDFVTDLQPTLRDDRLLGREAVVVTVEGMDGPAQRSVDELAAAGVDVEATLRLTRRLADPRDPQDLESLREILGTSSTAPADVAAEAADALATRLAVGPPSEGADILAALLDAGFVTADRDLDQNALRGIGGVSSPVVVAAGGPPRDDVPPPPALMVPLSEALVRLGALSAMVGPREDGYGFVAEVREDAQIPDCSVVTVDHVDTAIGGIALVLGLERLLLDPDPGFRPGGDYGIDGDSLVPGGEPPASCRE